MTERRREKIVSVLRRRQPDLTAVIENIHDPHNVSAILRTADAIGMVSIQLVYSTENFPKLGKKSSASAVKWVKRRSYTSIEQCYSQLRHEGYLIYATHIGGTSTSLYDLDLTKRIALVFGNEHRGVSEGAALLADKAFQIPMVGMIQSLNVSVACAVCFYEAFRQRQEAGRYKKSGLTVKERKNILNEWAGK